MKKNKKKFRKINTNVLLQENDILVYLPNIVP